VEKVVAAVKIGPSAIELREFAMPEVDDESALLKMEVAGICGTDVKMFKQPLKGAPVIMGHENIGYIAKAGRKFTERKGAASASGVTKVNIVTAKIPIGATTLTASATDIHRQNVRHICGADLLTTCICLGMRSCTRFRPA
jgi:NADPH:quinone reductase-like Zn-dependent oxidoreductase